MSNHNKSIGGEYGDVRASINVDSLNAYLAKSVPAVKTPVAVKQFKYGQSNPTYFLTDAKGMKFVLRKKPAGQLLSSTAHQVDREYTVLNALHQYNIKPTTPVEKRVPVPEPYILCDDPSVIGSSFYIMEFLEGRIFTNVFMLQIPAQDRRECWLAAVRALAALSSLLPSEVGLEKFGPPTDYFPRQIKSLTRISNAQAQAVDIETNLAIGPIPRYEHMMDWYRSHLPDETKTGPRIVHGDYKLDNLVFHPTENRVIGILDWELCTIGSPLADLANLTQPWAISTLSLPPPITEYPLLRGFKGNARDAPPITSEEMEKEYCRCTKWPYPIVEMAFVRSWMFFRLAVISQGIAARHARRQASSEIAFIHVHLFPLVGELAIKSLENDGQVLKSSGKL